MQIHQKSLTLTSRTTPPFFTLTSNPLPYTPTDILIKIHYFSIDPVMKFFMAGTKTYFRVVNIGDIFNCFGIAEIIQGNSQEGYQKGQFVFGNVGTCDYNVLDQERRRECFVVERGLVQMYGVKEFLYLINNGLAAYAGYHIMKPKEGERVVVSTASGATGLLLCQLLKKKGVKVIGLTSINKIKAVVPYCQHVVDYKDKKQLQKILKQNKFKYYFDNVGQTQLDTILQNIEIHGKIALCGAIANYNNYTQRGIQNLHYVISKRLTLEGLTFLALYPQIHSIFQEYKGVDFNIMCVGMEMFQEVFRMLLESGNNIVGKVVVKL